MRARLSSRNVCLLSLALACSAVGVVAQNSNKIAAPSGWVPNSVAYIKASNTFHDYQFGYAVAISRDGNTLAVGSVNESSNAKTINGVQTNHSANDAGAVYVYARRNGAWAQQAYIKASNPREGALFGNAVTLSNDGNTLAVGSYLESSGAAGINGDQMDTSMDSAGAVYIFTRTGANWAQQAYVKASNPGEGDQFGFAVALNSDGNTLAVSAIEEASKATGINGDQKDDSMPGVGAVYVFSRTTAKWAQQSYVKPEAAGRLFGYGVGLSADGNTLAVGASDEGPGTVYAFTRSGSAWSQTGHIKAVNAEGGDSLGWSVAISGDGNTIVAGATDEDSLLTGVPPNDQGGRDQVRDTSAGAAYIFVRSGDNWTQQAWVKPINTRKNDQFGWSTTISGDGNTIAVGSHFGAGPGGSKGVNADPSDDTVSASGSVYVYTRTGTTWVPAAYVKAPNAKISAEFGSSVSLNNDGKTLAVGAPRETSAAKGINGNQADTSAPDAGATYVYY